MKYLYTFVLILFLIQSVFAQNLVPDAFGDITVCIKTAKGNFISADDDAVKPIFANKTAVGLWERFKLVKQAENQFAIQACSNQKFITSGDAEKPLLANRDKAGPWETFELIHLEGNHFALKAHTEKYISANNGGGSTLAANRDKLADWETFEIIRMPYFALQTSGGQYFSLQETGDVKATAANAGWNERFEIITADAGKIAIKAFNGKFLVIDNTGARATAPDLKTATLLFFQKKTDKTGDKVVLKNASGKTIFAVGGGRFAIKADAADNPAWVTFTLQPLAPELLGKMPVADNQKVTKGDDKLTTNNSSDVEFSPNERHNFLLIIACDKYQYWKPLNNAVKDAGDVKKVLLERYRFQPENVLELYNEKVTPENLRAMVEKISGKISGNDNLLIYFSGHGFYDAKFDEGYWIPVNARLGQVTDYIPNSTLVKYIKALPTKHTFLIADACFSGSLFSGENRGYVENAEQVKSRWGLSSGNLEFVQDGEKGKNSPFATYLIKYLKDNKKPKLLVTEVIQHVKISVSDNSEQTPIGNPLKNVGHEGGEFVFYLK